MSFLPISYIQGTKNNHMYIILKVETNNQRWYSRTALTNTV